VKKLDGLGEEVEKIVLKESIYRTLGVPKRQGPERKKLPI